MIETLINTLIGMGIVFIALILISFIIYLLKPISDIIQGTHRPKKIQIKDEQVIDTPINEPEDINIEDETELVAVITAAIMASYSDNNYSPDGLVVRRIRRLSK